MAHAERLREAVQVIRANPRRWDQCDYAEGPVNPNASSWKECNTKFCLGGWGAVLNGYLPSADENGYANGLFYLPERPGESFTGEEAGGLVFDLTEEEAECLFYCATDDVDELAAEVESVIRGDIVALDE